ncbi:hypothetical protein [Sphingomonas sp.]|uniref:hypothetical protein n=1 Tax=Sphingomonas sp. TaxID=28214 RepID=UPI001B0BAEB1|nr:hypothetical protein [Sphingomonas sp.]MBO9712281.1 hypothetical protein [Sphingomonas sp.]
MSIAVPLAILAISVVLLLGAIALVRHLGQRFGWTAEVQRKSVHISIGLYALLLPLLFQQRWPVVLLILLALALMLLLRTPASRTAGLGAAIHSVERKSWGDVLLAVAIGFVFLRANGNYILYALPIAVIAISDAAAALAGSSYGRRRFHVEEGMKSYEGVAVFFFVTWIVAMVMLLLLTDIPRPNVVVLAMTIAVFGALVEAVSWRGLDNLFVPVTIHFFLAGYLNAPPVTLALLGIGFTVAVLAVALLTPRLGLSVHASRALVIAIFFFLGVGGAHGSVLPVLAIAAHLVARVRMPAEDAHPDLDFIATLCAVGLIWYFVGETTGPNAINLYNMSLAGMLLALVMLAVRMDWRLLVPVYIAVLALYLWLVDLSPGYSRWAHGLTWLAGGSLGAVAAMCLGWPGWYQHHRAFRIAGISSFVPALAYFTQAVIA